MCDLIRRQDAIDAHYEYCNKHPDAGFPVWSLKILEDLPSAQPETHEERTETLACDLISRQAAIRWVKTECNPYGKPTLDFESGKKVIEHLKQMPSAQPFHNITMDDVLKFIDRMPEDVWQEFTACLECRGWELQRRTAKWCGSEFA